MAVCYDETVVPRTGRDRAPVDTLCTTVSPGVTLTRRSGPDLLSLKYDLRSTMHEEMENRDTLTHSAGLTWRKRLHQAVTANVDERFTYLPIP